MELEGKKVLVTGAGGFIGSHLVEELVKLGAQVRAFIKYNSTGDVGNLEKLTHEIFKKVEIVFGDIQNIESVKKAVTDMDVVFHLGALISIPYSYENPREYFDVNTIGTLNILEAAKECKTGKVVITSTSEVYGTAIYTPIDENHPLQAQSPYSASKIAAEKIAESFYKSYNVPVAIIRPFNTYGPRQSMRAIIPTIIVQALTQEKIKLGSLTPTRDFNYVKDTVQGFIKIAESENSVGEVTNIGSGKTVSIGELVKMVESILGKELIVETDESRIRPEKSEVKVLLCNNTKAKNLIGWVPNVSLHDGLKEVIDYVKDNIKEFDSGKYCI
jgi:NAD dependent epimerase/dehydratase